MTHEESMAAAQEVLGELLAVVMDRPHGPALVAVLSLLHTLGMAYPCCTANLASDCAALSAALRRHAESNQLPAGAAFH